MASPLILDTSGIVALYDADSAEHASFVAAAFAPGTLRLVSAAILSEIDYMLAERVNPAAATKFLDAIVAGFYECEAFDHEDARYVQALHLRYPALRLGLADGAVMALADRLRCPRILTADRRHFSAVKPLSFEAFVLVGYEAVPAKRRRKSG
ncbi:MAG: type II toxin-antitoxin system VapC family toxin [Burkholderiales bacterium]